MTLLNPVDSDRVPVRSGQEKRLRPVTVLYDLGLSLCAWASFAATTVSFAASYSCTSSSTTSSPSGARRARRSRRNWIATGRWSSAPTSARPGIAADGRGTPRLLPRESASRNQQLRDLRVHPRKNPTSIGKGIERDDHLGVSQHRDVRVMRRNDDLAPLADSREHLDHLGEDVAVVKVVLGPSPRLSLNPG
jgi:predicted acyl esterase